MADLEKGLLAKGENGGFQQPPSTPYQQQYGYQQGPYQQGPYQQPSYQQVVVERSGSPIFHGLLVLTAICFLVTVVLYIVGAIEAGNCGTFNFHGSCHKTYNIFMAAYVFTGVTLLLCCCDCCLCCGVAVANS
jgi:hypothetical protein